MKWLKEQAIKKPEKLFLNDLTFRQVMVQVVTRAAQLQDIAEPRVALKAENKLSSLLSLFALLALGKEVLMLNQRLTEGEIAEQTASLGISQIIDPDNLPPVMPERTPDLNWEPADDKIAILMNTSATTGKFKTVPITWGMISAQVAMSAERIGVEVDDNWLVVLPIFHVSGLSIIMRSLYNGTRATILPAFNEEEILSLVENEAVNMMSLVPTQLKRMIDRLERHRLRMILLGGEYIPQSLITTALEKQLPIYKTYGMTETFSQSVTFNILDAPEKAESVGRPLPGVTLEIRKKDADGIGEVWLSSPALMAGYLDREPIGDFLETGDIGYLDADDYLHILNRRTDIIISGGENIYPKEIEDLLYQLPGVRECAVVPQANEQWGQVPVLYVATDYRAVELNLFMKEHLASYKLPKAIIIMDSLPKNTSGKILRKELLS
ncbi:o-succinylbenzoate--CoA ligase [Lactococcus termiticola]|uniref:2-succinylbenzoate--CoA ligase n=1 Tax=Lactococcus termiticola TaxID=2169526 RepID=A0A2R5HEB1_9LACT|nr:o-succinylbenzoate--CoA ligase [Lactococcus termiticola]GBG96427.1 2-succinylbenzoate--CoA ligase [Lactococcus termiticola]